MVELNQTKEQNPEAEIQELSRLLEEKKKALLERGETKEHKEIFQEVFSEKYKEALSPSSGGGASGAVSQPSRTKPSDDPQHKIMHERQLQILVDFSMMHGLMGAVAKAGRETPWLLDALHDRLADEYYQKLVQAKEIKAL
ncbi:hypothetical protein KGQ34_03025 [Patescibacteria group bacterium]|nr:hypothetical protein [Patescibacteria group bacterium]